MAQGRIACLLGERALVFFLDFLHLRGDVAQLLERIAVFRGLLAREFQHDIGDELDAGQLLERTDAAIPAALGAFDRGLAIIQGFDKGPAAALPLLPENLEMNFGHTLPASTRRKGKWGGLSPG